MRILQPQPWSFGVRLAEEPEGVLRLTVAAGSRVDGQTVESVAEAASNSKNSADIWVTMLVRDRALVSVRGDTRLTAGDEVLISAEERWHPQLESLFRAI
jgi:cell volume regulation protein A